jgi:hypothetical protein
MAEEVKNEEAAEAPVAPDVGGLLAVFPGAPGKDQLELWKQEHGEIFCSGFSETELFVWRALSRREYVNLQKQLRTPPQNGQEPLTDLDYEELVVRTCVLWSSVKNLNQKGGSISTLSEQVLMNSNFMPPQMAQAFVIKL